ncbi:MAG TPA: sulfatase [Humisphaera sp.]
MRFALLAVLLSTALAPAAARAADAPPRKPNVVVFLIDDLGERDVGCYGSTFHETPNIDKLATQGMRFTQAYAAACICSPTRAALLTGKSPARLHLTDWIPGHARPKAKLAVPKFNLQLPATEVTLAELLKAQGYATAAIGKWHLGGAGSLPTDHGFDLNLGGTDKGQPPTYFSPYRIATLPDGPPGEFLTDRLATEAEKFIEANKAKPFFVYVPDFAVHQPIMAKKEHVEHFKAKGSTGPQKNAVYAGLLFSTDEMVGRVLKKLDDLKLADDTVVVFAGDNGGLIGNMDKPTGPTSCLPLRAGKGTQYEGGIRVPLIVRYPRATKPGATSDVPVVTQDLFATLAELTGVKGLADPKPGDGASLVPVLTGAGGVAGGRDAVYWHYPHYHPGGATPCAAVRQGDWKLIHFFEDGRLELFDLKNDPGEAKNLAAAEPERARAMDEKLTAWLKTVDAQMPTPNPNYDPAKAAEGPKKKEE